MPTHRPNAPWLETLSVRASPINGRGLFATVALPPRRKLGELGGRLVRLPEARKRAQRRPKIYLVEFSRRLALDCRQGNAFKHLNHHCTPNCYLRIFNRKVEVYTLRAIAKGAELTVDYGRTPHKGGMVCRCGSAVCRGRL